MPRKPFGHSNEIGAPICYWDGQIFFGKFREGTPTSVNIQYACPGKAVPIGLYHTHPGGIAQLSRTDVKSGQRVRARIQCVNADGDLRCYEDTSIPWPAR